MLLVMDVGNTNIVFGIYDQEKLLHHWRMQTDRNATEDEYAMTFKHLLSHVGLEFSQIKGAILSSVVPPITYVLRKLSEKYLMLSPLVLGPGVKTGLHIQTDDPREVGADRIANAVAAVELYGAPAIIVDFGTATTFCYVDEQARYFGGAIAPGVQISAEALYQRAAKLTRVEIVQPTEVVGKNTVHAVQSGIYYGYVGLVDGIVSRMKEQSVVTPTVIATGGLASLICHSTQTIDKVDPLLTLEGLKLIYKRNLN
ncbi:type III pantothenate kinase [Shimazuella alba]|uniref:Type III pantothenate kinase n=1 Tax=Shimazuella alba TaxID=2690964 RepID=A0A6I4W2Q5_9BACL|nr:type III pantothenate kinase [Shimazuella alba]MXQ54542.1 type III pantothenate kinase [Shimazuella alba]